MLKYKCLFLITFLMVCHQGFSQKKESPVYDFSKYQKAFPDKQQIAVNSEVKLTFEMNEHSGTPVALEKVTETILSIENYENTFSNAIFFDEESEVLKLVEKKGKKSSDIPRIISDYESNGIFHNDVKICAFEKKFYKKGETLDYSYVKKYRDLKYLTKIYFHENYPIAERKIVIDVPEWMSVEIKEFNFEGYEIKSSKEVIGNSTRHVYEIVEIKPFTSENGAPNMARIYPHILLLSKNYQKEGVQENVLSNTADLYKWYRQLVVNVGNKTDDLTELVQQLTGDKPSELEKVKAIFYWVQDNVRYIAFENGIMGFKPAACQDVLSKKYGDCKGMANLTKEMLKLAGFDARLTWLGTSDLPYDYSIPSLVVDNHMICTLILDGKRYFLDPTEEFIEFGNYAHRIQGSQVLIENGDSYHLDNIPVLPAKHNQTVTRMKLSINEETVSGSVKVRLFGESKTRFLRILAGMESDIKEEALLYYLKSGEKNVKVSEIITSDLGQRDGEVALDYDVMIENQITAIGKEIYCNFDAEKDFANMKFEEDRELPFEFSKKVYLDTEVEFSKPAGWKIDYLPGPVAVKEDGYEFDLRFREDAGKIFYTKKIILNNVELSKADMPKWNGHIKRLNEFYSDQLIFIKP